MLHAQAVGTGRVDASRWQVATRVEKSLVQRRRKKVRTGTGLGRLRGAPRPRTGTRLSVTDERHPIYQSEGGRERTYIFLGVCAKCDQAGRRPRGQVYRNEQERQGGVFLIHEPRCYFFCNLKTTYTYIDNLHIHSRVGHGRQFFFFSYLAWYSVACSVAGWLQAFSGRLTPTGV